MTLKTKKVHQNLDGVDAAFLLNFGVQTLTSDPATTYARIYYNSVSGTFKQYSPLTSAWTDLGSSVSVDNVTIEISGGALQIKNNGVSNGKLAQMAANTVKANTTGGTANAADVTLSSFKTWLALVKADVGLSNVNDVAQLPLSYLDTDGTLAANSDTRVASQKALKTYADQIIAAADAFVYKGAIDCSANPNYPAADAGHAYKISVAGKIGGASGAKVEVGDTAYCTVDGSSAGTQAAVGANWNIVQANLDGAVIGPASVTDGSFSVFDGASGKLVKERTIAQAKTDLGITGTESRKYAVTFGDNAATDFVITHSLGSRDVHVAVIEVASPYAVHDVYWEATSTTTLTLFFPTAPATNEFRCVVIG